MISSAHPLAAARPLSGADRSTARSAFIRFFPHPRRNFFDRDVFIRANLVLCAIFIHQRQAAARDAGKCASRGKTYRGLQTAIVLHFL